MLKLIPKLMTSQIGNDVERLARELFFSLKTALSKMKTGDQHVSFNIIW